MGLKVTDESGNQIELPVDKVEDLATLKERADKAEQLEKDINPDWKTARQKMTDQETTIKTSSQRIADLERDLAAAKAGGGQQGGQGGQGNGGTALTPEEIDRRSETKAEEVFNKKEVARIEKVRETLLEELSGGDVTRKKTIDEKYKELVGGRTDLSEEEMKQKMDDAEFLVNRNRNGGGSTFNRVSGGGAPGGQINRSNTGQREKAVSHLQSAGFRFKGDPQKLINK